MDREQPPLDVRPGRCCYRPAFLWAHESAPQSSESKAPVEPGRLRRRLPPAAETSAAEVEEHVRAWLEAEGYPLPPEGSVAARVLRVADHIPLGQTQMVIALLKHTPPFWGVTTRPLRA